MRTSVRVGRGNGLAVANLEDDDALQLVLPLDRFSGTALDDALDDVRR